MNIDAIVTEFEKVNQFDKDSGSFKLELYAYLDKRGNVTDIKAKEIVKNNFFRFIAEFFRNLMGWRCVSQLQKREYSKTTQKIHQFFNKLFKSKDALQVNKYKIKLNELFFRPSISPFKIESVNKNFNVLRKGQAIYNPQKRRWEVRINDKIHVLQEMYIRPLKYNERMERWETLTEVMTEWNGRLHPRYTNPKIDESSVKPFSVIEDPLFVLEDVK